MSDELDQRWKDKIEQRVDNLDIRLVSLEVTSAERFASTKDALGRLEATLSTTQGKLWAIIAGVAATGLTTILNMVMSKLGG